MVSDGQCSLGGNFVAFDFAEVMKGSASLRQDDPKLIEVIRTQYLNPASTKPYKMKNNKDDPSQFNQPTEILKLLGPIRNGFFIECGAYDGETFSNTLNFERTLGWRGLLVEGDPNNYKALLRMNRKAWTVGACLSIKPFPHSVMFQMKGTGGLIRRDMEGKVSRPKNVVEVQCLPLFSLLLALNVTTVDYFSLDVEGLELEVLKTIPWDKVHIKTLSVEHQHGVWSKDDLRRYMEQQGYWTYNNVTKFRADFLDFIFVKNTFKTRKEYLSSRQSKQ
ncbi:uncharacterized protein LOC108678160 [Hyalella azteca]|uniref:Uncharacterized protein LOC108678160 n=1 Tax=Hyalella azteca TaxID=294128 RepID=A0A979FK96_HYAAZ|nr:uncharacterized protein LOC108678160 [Hyalella azteca]